MSRYFQQMLVSEIGDKGQEKIAQARVLIIGGGGLGTPASVYLAATGIGNLGIVDGDRVSVSNLQRQFLFNPEDKGLNKAEVLATKLQRQNPDIRVKPYPVFISEANIGEIISDYDVICDCTDNLEARLVIDATCAGLNKPLVYAAVRDWEGYVSVFSHKSKIRLADIFALEDLKVQALNNCSVAGIVGMTCGVVGSLQATEVLKIILDSSSVLDGEILCINILENNFRKFKIRH